MWPDDIVKALEILNLGNSVCIVKIEKGVILLSNFKEYSIRKTLQNNAPTPPAKGFGLRD